VAEYVLDAGAHRRQHRKAPATMSLLQRTEHAPNSPGIFVTQ
jgi:hypothetical protein